MTRTVTHPAAALVMDTTIYPRHGIDEANVKRLADALEAGEELPPIIVQKGTLRIVDGFHRTHAHLRVYGDTATVETIERIYTSDADLFLDAMRANARHGVTLTRYDEARCYLRSLELGIDLDHVAGALSITTERLNAIAIRKMATLDGTPVPIKATAGHLSGRALTAEQKRGIERSSGLQPTYYVTQVTNILAHDLIDWDNLRLVAALRDLQTALDLALTAHPAPTASAAD